MGRYLDLADQVVAGRRAPSVPARLPTRSPANSAVSRLLPTAPTSLWPHPDSAQRCYELNEVNERSPTSPPLLLEWREGVRKLGRLPCPDTIPAPVWNRLKASSADLLDRWGRQAAALGWSTLDLFGAHQQRPLARYDAAGLVILLDGAQVIAMSTDTAEIRTRSGARQCYVRRAFTEPGQVALWELK